MVSLFNWIFLQDEIDPIMQYSKTIQESVYSVEDVTSEINMEQDNYMLEDDSSFGDRVLLQPSIFPLLEVDEIKSGYYDKSFYG